MRAAVKGAAPHRGARTRALALARARLFPDVSSMPLTNSEMAARLQSTLVDPTTTRDEVTRHVEACGRHGFHAAMIPMCWVPLARSILKGTPVRVATFICIGMGHETAMAKAMLLRECWALGADEVDYQPNMSFFLSGMEDEFAEEARLLARASEGKTLKAMLELGYIADRPSRVRAASLLADAGVPWIKNSSGVGPKSEPATVENITLLREAVGNRAHVKGSGKIRTRQQAEELIAAGAELLGTSAAQQIIGASDRAGAY
jgi:deoxyribose-phosphate aldolase